MDFEIFIFIFSKFGNFKKFFEILRTLNIPIVRKMTLYDEIIFQPREIVYIRVDYTGLSKGRSFIMIKIYPKASNVILNFTTSRIAILINSTKRILKIDKGIYIATIYECIDTTYFIIGSFEMFVVLTIVLVAISELLSFV